MKHDGKYPLRDGALEATYSEKTRLVTAPWIMTRQYPDFEDLAKGMEPWAEPLELRVAPGEGLVYDPDRQIVHIRHAGSGRARTFTPHVRVHVDLSDRFYEVEFRDPADPVTTLPAVELDGDHLKFNCQKAYDFSNTAVFEAFCDHLNSPIYNPFAAPIEARFNLEPDDDEDDDDSSIMVFDVAAKTIRMTDGSSVDQVRNPLLRFTAVLDRPISAWDKDTREDGQFGPGVYSVEVGNSDWTTGSIVAARFEGDDNNGRFRDMIVEWDVFERELDLQHARFGNVVERKPFDPSIYRPLMPSETGEAFMEKFGYFPRISYKI